MTLGPIECDLGWVQGAWPLGSSAGVESPVEKWYTHSPQALACFLSRVGTRGHFWTALLLSGHEVICVRSHNQWKVDSDLESMLFELLHASSPLHKNSKSVSQGWQILWQLCQFYLENEKGRDEILCEVQRNEANLTDIYLICVFAHWVEARGHVLVPRVDKQKTTPFSVRKVTFSLQTTVFFFGVSISADSPIQRDPRGTKWKQEGPTLV